MQSAQATRRKAAHKEAHLGPVAATQTEQGQNPDRGGENQITLHKLPDPRPVKPMAPKQLKGVELIPTGGPSAGQDQADREPHHKPNEGNL